ncbi:cation:proton antiporter domain-containing protein [Nonomuraea sp. CA-141351]|uniref:cation:proton antiporter domain-containing protein n=1 Tax=Nonomuraea sp. CA-141351 TaxID=3239996 RepID=UPI003D8D0E1A
MIATLAVSLVLSAGASEGHAGRVSQLVGEWSPATRFLLVVAVVVASAHLVGAVARRFGQPPVVGEILAGILLGPTLLGAVYPAAWHWLFPGEILGALDMTAQLGLVTFMFTLGCETRLDRLRGLGPAVTSVGLANLIVPFVCGLPLALFLYQGHDVGGSLPGFVLFFGLALSITALPVLARILQDRHLLNTAVGTLAIGSAAFGDVIAWTALAFVLTITGAAGGSDALLTLALAIAFTTVMFWGVRPALATLVRRTESARFPESALLSLVLVGSIASAVSTQLIGVHAVLGAFAFGAMMPRESLIVRRIVERIQGVTVAILLPVFFAYVGLHTSVGVFGSSPARWLTWIGILAVAMATKILGGSLMARFSGLPGTKAVSLGILMNCRGLTELVFANIGFQLGIIDEYLFTVLVLVALVTTALTGPMLQGLGWWERRRTRQMIGERT